MSLAEATLPLPRSKTCCQLSVLSEEYEASPGNGEVRLYRPDAQEGFEEIRPGRYRRLVSESEVDELVYVRTLCSWQGAPFIVLVEADAWLRVDHRFVANGGGSQLDHSLDRGVQRERELAAVESPGVA